MQASVVVGLAALRHMGFSLSRDRTSVPSIAGGFSTTGTPGKIRGFILKIDVIHVDVWQKTSTIL